jgi:hypothetical protein
METFQGTMAEVEQPGKVIKLHLTATFRQVLNEYKTRIMKALRPKRAPMSLGLLLNYEDCPVVTDPQMELLLIIHRQTSVQFIVNSLDTFLLYQWALFFLQHSFGNERLAGVLRQTN